jgi:long-chain acyl-CoA synthetase
MGDSNGGLSNSQLLKNLGAGDYLSLWKGYGPYGIVGAVIIGLLIPILLSALFLGKKKEKQRGVPVQVGGEAGYAVRNARVSELVEAPWEGATTMAALFEQSCKKNSRNPFLGTRKLISREFVTGSDGRKFEKLHLGDYEWQTYGEIFDRACNFASGLIKLGHDLDSRAAIFSDTRAEWFIALQVVFFHSYLTS